MRFRVRWRQLGGHIHCRMFESVDGESWAKNGDLVFDARSWPVACGMLIHGGYEVLTEHDERGVPNE
jgi:hypothetical protein